jgi:hypothetical protein
VSEELIAILLNCCNQPLHLELQIPDVGSHQYDPWYSVAPAKDEIAKILVFG